MKSPALAGKKQEVMVMPSKDTQWKKGQSGNPKGRIKGLSTHIQQKEKLLADLLNAIEKDWDKIVAPQLALAFKGDYQAVKLLFEYALPKQKVYILEKEGEDDLDLAGLDTPEKREQARAILLEAQSKVHELCVTTSREVSRKGFHDEH